MTASSYTVRERFRDSAIPAELRAYPQWVAWKLDPRDNGKPGKVPYSPCNGSKASVTDSTTWATFDEAVNAANSQNSPYAGVGFVLTRDDPFFFIDLDETSDPEETARQIKIVDFFPTYAEYSQSEKGLHLIGRGSLSVGRRRGNIELYSSDRFMVMTGNPYRDGPITDGHQSTLEILWQELGGYSIPAIVASEHYREASETDHAIYERATNAVNGDKFSRLWNGDGSDLIGDTSGSAIDMALVDILVFYSKNPEQVERLWLASPQGQRDKTQKRADYRSNTIDRAFDREGPVIDVSVAGAMVKAVVDQANITPQEPVTIMPPVLLPIIGVDELAGKPVAARQDHVAGLMPARVPILITGDGGTGKSQVALQLTVSTALGRPWFGRAVRPGKALFITAEDDVDEVHRRLAKIAQAEGVSLKELGNLAISSLAGRDALLAIPDRRSGALVPTPLYHTYRAVIEHQRPVLAVLDTQADLFGGDENNRAHARQFIAMLREPALTFDMTPVLLAHPSRTGLASGSGDAGSTAWNNSVRSRLYLERDEHEPGTRILSVKKANYGAIGEKIRLGWLNGVFVALGQQPDQFAHGVAAQQHADELFLKLLAEFASQGRTVSPNPSTRMSAAVQFANTPVGRPYRRGAFTAAMERLFATGRIRVEAVGPPSKRKEIIVAVGREGFLQPSDRIFEGSDPVRTPVPSPLLTSSDPLPSHPPYPPRSEAPPWEGRSGLTEDDSG